MMIVNINVVKFFFLSPLTQNFFKYNKYTHKIKNNLLKDIDKFTFLKKIGLKIADKGLI